MYVPSGWVHTIVSSISKSKIQFVMLRLLLVFIICCTLALESKAQNLVPNPSFEDTLYCPFFLGDLAPMVGWSSFGNTPDCFHSCADMTINVPNSDFGYQYAHSGNSMAGIISYVWELDPGWPNYREYMGIQLSSPLVIGRKYFVSFYINCAGYIPGSQHIGANKIGARFSTFQYDNTQPTIPDNFSHIHTDSIITDTVQWYKVTGSFIADSVYKFLVIGNFYDHIQTDTIIFGGAPFGGSVAYYYIDDVCVTADSMYNENWTNVNHTPPDKINTIYYPNPVNDKLYVESDYPINSFQLINYLGQVVIYSEWLNDKSLSISVNQYPAGHYFLKIKTLNENRFFKIIIN
jgi:hypothetical protein